MAGENLGHYFPERALCEYLSCEMFLGKKKKTGSVVKRIWVVLYLMPLLGELQHTLVYYRL